MFVSTVHQAKGLEWPIVFIARFNEGDFPCIWGEDHKNRNNNNFQGQFGGHEDDDDDNNDEDADGGVSRTSFEIETRG